jgi:hypothetical protein
MKTATLYADFALFYLMVMLCALLTSLAYRFRMKQ